MIGHYPGDAREGILGQVVGPDTAGGFLQAISAIHDHGRNRTTVRFRPLPADEALRATRRPGTEQMAAAALGQPGLFYLPIPDPR